MIMLAAIPGLLALMTWAAFCINVTITCYQGGSIFTGSVWAVVTLVSLKAVFEVEGRLAGDE